MIRSLENIRHLVRNELADFRGQPIAKRLQRRDDSIGEKATALRWCVLRGRIYVDDPEEEDGAKGEQNK